MPSRLKKNMHGMLPPQSPSPHLYLSAKEGELELHNPPKYRTTHRSSVCLMAYAIFFVFFVSSA